MKSALINMSYKQYQSDKFEDDEEGGTRSNKARLKCMYNFS